MARAPLLPLPAPGMEVKPMPGMRVWKNPGNEFVVVWTHYESDPQRRGDWKLRASPKYGGLRSWRWRKEQEIEFDAQSGSLVFENWNPDFHFIRPFAIPAHWPRWILFDPGWRNPASLLWGAVDVDAHPNAFGYLPVHIYREFYKARRSAATCAIMAYEWSHGEENARGERDCEWVEEIVVDPAAKQEHQAAATGDNVNDAAETVLQKFTEKLEALRWDVPVATGDNLKADAIEEMVARLGRFWVDADGVALYDESDKFREPTEAEAASEDPPRLVAPTLFIHSCCIHTAREFGKYRWADWASSQVAERHNVQETPVDKDDHSITNIIRLVNRLRDLRGPADVDLSEFESRPRPKGWKSPDEAALEAHRTLAARFRRRLAKKGRAA